MSTWNLKLGCLRFYIQKLHGLHKLITPRDSNASSVVDESYPALSIKYIEKNIGIVPRINYVFAALELFKESIYCSWRDIATPQWIPDFFYFLSRKIITEKQSDKTEYLNAAVYNEGAKCKNCYASTIQRSDPGNKIDGRATNPIAKKAF